MAMHTRSDQRERIGQAVLRLDHARALERTIALRPLDELERRRGPSPAPTKRGK
jgi:hypothetical protein